MNKLKNKRQGKLIFIIILIVIVAIFSVLNVDPVPVNFGFGRINGPLILVIIFSLVIGAVIALTAVSADSSQKNSELKRLRQAQVNFDSEKAKAVDAAKEESQTEIADLTRTLKQKENEIAGYKQRLNRQQSRTTAHTSPSDSSRR